MKSSTNTKKNDNPICPFTKKDCELDNMDSFTADCSDCKEYGNGVIATGGIPGLKKISELAKSFKSKLTIAILFVSVGLMSQSYLNVSIENGTMLNADPGFLKMGIATSISCLIPSSIPLGARCNYITFGSSLINYPHTGESYSFKNFNNGVDDAFHYAKILVGYRISIRYPESNGNYSYYRGWDRVEGLSFEPRIGTALYNFSFDNPTLLISPRVNYVRKGFQVSALYDYGQARNHTNIGYRTIFSVGLSVGYNFKL